MKQPAVYIMANKPNGTIYVGVTSNLVKRAYLHRNEFLDGFSKKYSCKSLVFYEVHQTMESEIIREEQLKAGSRQKKIKLIEAKNPSWTDLAMTNHSSSFEGLMGAPLQIWPQTCTLEFEFIEREGFWMLQILAFTNPLLKLIRQVKARLAMFRFLICLLISLSVFAQNHDSQDAAETNNDGENHPKTQVHVEQELPNIDDILRLSNHIVVQMNGATARHNGINLITEALGELRQYYAQYRQFRRVAQAAEAEVEANLATIERYLNEHTRSPSPFRSSQFGGGGAFAFGQ